MGPLSGDRNPRTFHRLHVTPLFAAHLTNLQNDVTGRFDETQSMPEGSRLTMPFSRPIKDEC